MAVLPSDPVALAAAHDGSPPGLVVDEPADGCAQARCWSDRESKAEFALGSGVVDRITPIVAGPVGDESDKGPGRYARRRRRGRESLPNRGFRLEQGVRDVAQHMNELDVLDLGSTHDIVGSPQVSRCQDPIDGTAMVRDKEPVADIAAVAVNGNRAPLENVDDDQRDQLLGELERSVLFEQFVVVTCRP